ncbi:MAG: hypothetical protein ABI881_17185 [Betaproteobacteria bacterium]
MILAKSAGARREWNLRSGGKAAAKFAKLGRWKSPDALEFSIRAAGEATRASPNPNPTAPDKLIENIRTWHRANRQF